MSNIEEKLNMILNKVEEMDVRINKKLDGHIDFVNERATEIEDRLDRIKDNIATTQDIKSLELKILDKYAEKDTVLKHDVRITNLEKKLV